MSTTIKSLKPKTEATVNLESTTVEQPIIDVETLAVVPPSAENGDSQTLKQLSDTIKTEENITSKDVSEPEVDKLRPLVPEDMKDDAVASQSSEGDLKPHVAAAEKPNKNVQEKHATSGSETSLRVEELTDDVIISSAAADLEPTVVEPEEASEPEDKESSTKQPPASIQESEQHQIRHQTSEESIEDAIEANLLQKSAEKGYESGDEIEESTEDDELANDAEDDGDMLEGGEEYDLITDAEGSDDELDDDDRDLEDEGFEEEMEGGEGVSLTGDPVLDAALRPGKPGLIEEVWLSIFEPGVTSGVIKVMDYAFYGLFASLALLLIGTMGNIHVVFLLLVSICLFASVKWWVLCNWIVSVFFADCMFFF
jgi:hypothetical protein